MSTIRVDVNPKILVWAREERGFNIDYVASKVKKDASIIQDWETHGCGLPYTILVKLSQLYKRQVAVFFLSNTPPETKKPEDFRNLNRQNKELSPDAMLAIRRTKRYLELYREYMPAEQLKNQYKWLQVLRERQHDGLEETLRDLLDVPISEQKKKKNQNLKFWRNRIEEKLNIFVFQFPVDESEFDGFSYIADGPPFGITLSNKATENRKIFTLFHEIAHIIKDHAGICITGPSRTSQKFETRCNKFAAGFLMPKNEMAIFSSFEDLQSRADELGVSREAYLIRAHDLNLVNDTDFFDYMTKIEQINKMFMMKQAEENKHGNGYVPRDILSKSYRGEKFFDFVLEIYNANRISPTVVRDVLDLKVMGL